MRTAQETAQHAAAGTTEAPQGAAPDAHPDHAELVSALDAAQRAASADTSAAAPPPVAVYFIERSLADSAQLAQSLPPGAEVHYIEPGTDGVQFIAQTLQGRSDVDAIHIFSHGAGGALQLGTASVGIEQMQADYRGELEAIGRSLSAEGDILIYACNFGAGSAGAQAVDLLASLTRADVAASVDDTGASQLGGNWILERQSGTVEAYAAAAPEWNHLMAAPVLTTTEFTFLNQSEDYAQSTAVTDPNTSPRSGTTTISLAISSSDSDTGAAAPGIAIVGADNTNGQWWFSTDSGATWTAMTGLSDANALLLTRNSTNRLYFQPNADWFGASSFTVRAWDQTQGTSGAMFNIAATGGETAFSATTATGNLRLTALADIVADNVGGANAGTEEVPLVFNPITGTGGARADNFEGRDTAVITAIAGIAIAPGGSVSVPEGTVTLGTDGQTLTFLGNTNFAGSSTFSYTVTSGGVTETADIKVAINGVDDPPMIDLDGTTEGTDFVGGIDQGQSPIANAAIVSDPENDNLTSMTVTLTNPLAGDRLTLSVNVANLVYVYNDQTGVLTISGTASVAAYQTALNGVRFSTTSSSMASRTLTVQATSENQPLASNLAVATIAPLDTDGDGIANGADIDDDNDGIIDVNEGAPAGEPDGQTGYQYWRTNDTYGAHNLVPLNGDFDLLPDVDQFGLPTNNSVPTHVGFVSGVDKPPDTDSSFVEIIRYQGYLVFPPELDGQSIMLRLNPNVGFLSAGAWVVSTDENPANWIDPVSVVTGEPLLDMSNSTGFVNPRTQWSGPPIGYSDEEDPSLGTSRGGSPEDFVATIPVSAAGNYFTYYVADPTAFWAAHGFQYSLDGGKTWQALPDSAFSSAPLVAGADMDSDGDGVVNRLDLDSDNDGIPDNVEAQATAAYLPPSGQGAAMTDADRDGLDDRYDANPADTTAEASIGLVAVDTDGDGTADWLDSDSDNDLLADIAERGDGQPTSLTSMADADGDGLLDIFEHGTVNDGYYVHDGTVTTTGSDLSTSTLLINLADSDGDVADDGRDAAPAKDFDWRDVAHGPIIDLNSDASSNDEFRDHGTLITGTDPVNVATPAADVTDFGENDLVSVSILLSGMADGNNEVINIGGADFLLATDSTQTVTVGGSTLQVSYTVAGGFTISEQAGGLVPHTALDILVRGITYSNALGLLATPGMRTLTFTVTDSAANVSPPAKATVQVPPNLPPDAIDDFGAGFEDQPLTGQLLSNDVDPESDPLSVVSFTVGGTEFAAGNTVDMPGFGSITIHADGSYVFVPEHTFFGPVPDIPYTIQDSAGLRDQAVLHITVAQVPDPPVPQDPNVPGQSFDPDTGVYSARTVEDMPFEGQVIATDEDGDVLTYTAGTPPAHGTVTIDPNTGAYTYTPIADFNGIDTFTVNVSDGTGNVVPLTVAMTVTSVVDIDHDTAVTEENTPVTFGVLGNDSFENPVRTIVAMNDQAVGTGGSVRTSHGSVTLNADGTLVYRPDARFFGEDSFTYTVSAGGVTERATVLLVVTEAPNVPPVLTNVDVPGQDFDPATGTYRASAPEDGGFSGQVGASDADGDTLSFSVAAPPSHGTVVLDPATGKYTYTPSPDYYGPDSFLVNVEDGMGGMIQARVEINVTPIADVADDRVATPRNVPVVIDVLANDSFEGPNPLVTAVNGLPISVGQSVAVAHGVVTLNADGTLTYVPNASYQSEDFFTYTVTSGGVTETATVHVVVPVPPRQDFVQVFLPPDPHEKPPGRLPIDSLFVEPAVITAANGQDWLGGTQTLNGASGAVLQAANGVDSLEGLNTLTERGIVIAAVNDLEALDGIDTRDRGRHGEWIRAQLADGSLPAPDFVSTLILRDGVRLELMQHGSRLWVDVQHNVRELRAVLADGRPLPPWVRVDARGFLVIDRPADSETLRLRLTIVPERGATRTHTIEIDLNSGQMQESGARETSRQGGRAMPAHHATQAPGLDFYLQLDMAADRIAAQDADLMALLETH